MIYQLLCNETYSVWFCLFNKVQNKRKHARQCSVISVTVVLYLTKCDMVWCGAYIYTVHNRIGLDLWKKDSIREYRTLFVTHTDSRKTGQ